MGLKSKVLAAAATLTILSGVSTVSAITAGTAGAATPSCGPGCVDIFSKNFGDYPPPLGAGSPKFALDVFQQKQAVGQPLILFRQANSDPAEDFTLAFEGQVSDFFQAGMVSAAFNLHYGCGWSLSEAKCTNKFPDEFAFEIEYAPFGVESGLCAGATSATPGTKVSLRPCGTGAGTVWAADTLDSCLTNPLYSLEVQAINGLNVNFSHPSVLTYPGGGFPTDKPRPQLYLSQLAGFSQDGNPPPTNQVCGGLAVNGPDNNQLWGAIRGILP